MKSERPPWFRCEPSRLLGALSGMEPDCGYLYTIVLMRIYEVGGPIDDDENVLARRTGFSSRRVAAALSWLTERDKIQRLENGLLDSRTTHEELLSREKFIFDAKNAGKASARKRTRKTQSKQQKPATVVEPTLDNSATEWQRKGNYLQEHIELASASSKPTPRSVLLGCLSPETADGVIAHRKAKGAPLTVLAAQELVKAFDSTGDPEDAAKTMVARGWQGFKLSWYQNDKSNGRNGKLSVQEAARLNHERGIDFGPAPAPYMPTGNSQPPSGNPAVMLSEGGRGEPRDLRRSGGVGLVLLPRAGSLSSD